MPNAVSWYEIAPQNNKCFFTSVDTDSDGLMFGTMATVLRTHTRAFPAVSGINICTYHFFFKYYESFLFVFLSAFSYYTWELLW